MPASPRVLATRLRKGQDLRVALADFAVQEDVRAAVITSMVGSFTQAKLRLAGADTVKTIEGPLEIVAVTGTINRHSMHVHLAVADKDGTTFGGHLVDGCLVNTTVELVLHDVSDEWTFDRDFDEQTGYPELAPKRSGKGEN